jgi:hypothetical protein
MRAGGTARFYLVVRTRAWKHQLIRRYFFSFARITVCCSPAVAVRSGLEVASGAQSASHPAARSRAAW